MFGSRHGNRWRRQRIVASDNLTRWLLLHCMVNVKPIACNRSPLKRIVGPNLVLAETLYGKESVEDRAECLCFPSELILGRFGRELESHRLPCQKTFNLCFSSD